MKKDEKTDVFLEACLDEMEKLTAIISDRLAQADIPVDGVFVEYWPIFLQNKIVYKIWDGITHLTPVDNKPADVPSWLTREELSGVIMRRLILKRRF